MEILFLSNYVCLSNGVKAEDLTYKGFCSGHSIRLKGVECLTSATFEDESIFGGRRLGGLLVETRYLGEMKDPEYLRENIQLALDTKESFTELVNVRKALESFNKELSEKAKSVRRQKYLTEKTTELRKEFSRLSDMLFSRVVNFDHYYDYSDDICVWRSGKEQEAALMAMLDEANCKDLMTRYRAILHKAQTIV